MSPAPAGTVPSSREPMTWTVSFADPISVPFVAITWVTPAPPPVTDSVGPLQLPYEGFATENDSFEVTSCESPVSSIKVAVYACATGTLFVTVTSTSGGAITMCGPDIPSSPRPLDPQPSAPIVATASSLKASPRNHNKSGP